MISELLAKRLFFTDEISDITWIQAFHIIMKMFMNTLTDKLSLSSEELDKLLDAFLAYLPKDLKWVFMFVCLNFYIYIFALLNIEFLRFRLFF